MLGFQLIHFLCLIFERALMSCFHLVHRQCLSLEHTLVLSLLFIHLLRNTIIKLALVVRGSRSER